MLNKFNQNGVKILDVFHCPHLPESNCNCRKPKPGMIIEAKAKFKLNLNTSWMVGDSERDITSANLAGINNTVLVRTGHKNDESNSSAKFIINSIQEISTIIVR
jgi:D-glycero-D-manno-heptose 1,7-bisphosphate phosphatase